MSHRSSRGRRSDEVCYPHPVAREELKLDRHIVLGLDGPGVSPETVDAALVLRPHDVQPLDSILSVRAVPLQIGGLNPLAHFRSEFEPEPFTLSVTESLARKLGPYLYKEVDIEAKVARGADGRIERGRLEEFEPVEDGEPRPAWRAWFESVGGNECEPSRHRH